ncbi:MAG: XdhC family protein [Myxococcota bacterium]|jgi:xanthine dehydrogenase accessory factor
MKRATLDALVEGREARRALVRLLWIESGEERILTDALEVKDDEELATAVRAALRTDRASLFETASGKVFVHPFNPPLRLAIVGAVHIAQRLTRLALDLGYAVTIIDPRRGFLTEARFPGVTRVHDWPDDALRNFELDARSAVVTLSHDAKIDEPALDVALRSPCFYIGALGSRRTQQKRRDRLAEAGMTDEALARIHGPVGLDLGARSPAEIALSIAAELTATLRAD